MRDCKSGEIKMSQGLLNLDAMQGLKNKQILDLD